MLKTELTQLETDIRKWTQETDQARRDLLVTMQKIQDRYGEISEQAIRILAEAYHIQPAEILGLASLFPELRLQKSKKYHFKVCDGLACACADQQHFYQDLSKKAEFDPKQASDESLFGLDYRGCMGMCDQRQVISVNDQLFTAMSGEKLETLLENCRSDKALPASDYRLDSPVFRQHGQGKTPLDQMEPGAVFSGLAKAPVSALIDQLVRDQVIPSELIRQFQGSNEEPVFVCNTDTAIAGSFAGRVLIADHCEFFLECLLACAYLARAKKAILYLTPEYLSLKPILVHLLKKIISPGLKQRFALAEEDYICEVDIRLSPGFVGGGFNHIVEIAVNSDRFAGKRPEIPFSPSVTLDAQSVFQIGLHLAAQGQDAPEVALAPVSIIALSGACEQPGIYLTDRQTIISDFLDKAGCDHPAGIWVDGLMGGFHSAQEFGKTFSELGIRSVCQIVVLGGKADLHSAAGRLLKTLSENSCGQCAPCREGLSRMFEIYRQPKNGLHSKTVELVSIAECVNSASKCDYGRKSAECVLSWLAAFPESI